MRNDILTLDDAARKPIIAGDSPCRIAFLDACEIDGQQDLRDAWSRLARKSDFLYAFYQSPEWWDYLQPAKEDQRYVVGVVRDAERTVTAVVPIRFCRLPLRFAMRGREFARLHVRAASILGNHPPLPDDESIYVRFFQSILDEFPDCDCIDLGCIAVGGYCWKVISESQEIRRRFSVSIRRNSTPHYFIDVPDTFERYLAKFKSKMRYNLKREVKLLRQRGSGRLELLRIERESDVEAFLDEATAISRNSWQYRELGAELENGPEERDKFIRLARQGALRSYLLRCGNDSCAFVRSFQYENAFYYSWCGFDRRYAEFSPGKVLLYLLIEDLCSHRPPKRLTFLWGDAPYKNFFGTGFLEDASVLLVRKKGCLAGRMRIGAHSAFQSALAALKHWLPGKASSIRG